MGKKIIARINRKTGKLTIQTEGYSGAECLEATRKIREGLGIDAEPDKTPEFFTDEVKVDQDQSL